MPERPSTILVTCARGLIEWLEAEVRELGYEPASVHRTSLTLTGTMRDCMRLNLSLRTAFEVHLLLEEWSCHDAEALYRGVVALPWESWIEPDGYLTVTSRVDTPSVNNSMFPSLKVKDAIVDRIAERRGRRPDAGPDRTGVVVTLYWKDDRAHLYINTSGRKLADRGYRRMPHTAPMQETLAAAVIRASGYDGTQPLVAPMCGSGTLAIEAALIGAGRAPGLGRANFGMLHLTGFDHDAWKTMRLECRKQAKRHAPPAPIIASDIDDRAIEAAKRNAMTAGVEKLIDFHVCDFAQTPMPEPGANGIVLMNPEYGRRLGEDRRLETLYGRIGDFLKQRCAGLTGYIFTGNLDLAKRIGLKATRRTPFVHSGLDCRLLKFEIYAGSRRSTPSGTSNPHD